MSSYRYRKSHCGDKTVVRSSYLHNGISYTGKMSSLYWIGALLLFLLIWTKLLNILSRCWLLDDMMFISFAWVIASCMFITKLQGSSPGVGVTKAPFLNFSVSKIFDPVKYMLDYLHHIHIWLVSPQLSCGNTCQIWTWYTIANMYFGDPENNGTEEIGLVTPTPGPVVLFSAANKWIPYTCVWSMFHPFIHSLGPLHSSAHWGRNGRFFSRRHFQMHFI